MLSSIKLYFAVLFVIFLSSPAAAAIRKHRLLKRDSNQEYNNQDNYESDNYQGRNYTEDEYQKSPKKDKVYVLDDETANKLKQEHADELKDFDPASQKIVCSDEMKTESGDITSEFYNFLSEIFNYECNIIEIFNNNDFFTYTKNVYNKEETPVIVANNYN